jgi:hypothetical protein
VIRTAPNPSLAPLPVQAGGEMDLFLNVSFPEIFARKLNGVTAQP